MACYDRPGAHNASECWWGPVRELRDRGESPAKTGRLARVSQGPMCKGCVTSSVLVVMPARPQSLGMLCPWCGNPRLGVSEPLPRLSHPTLPHAISRFLSSAPQTASPRGWYRWVSFAVGLPRGYLLWQAHACMCAVCSGHGHIIYLFTHIPLTPLGRTHAAEVLGGSAAITVYWS